MTRGHELYFLFVFLRSWCFAAIKMRANDRMPCVFSLGMHFPLMLHQTYILPLEWYRFALILSKTMTLDVDLSAIDVILIDDEPCRVIISILFKIFSQLLMIRMTCILNVVFQDEHGKVAYDDGERLIHTDGTGYISENLAKKCPKRIIKGMKSQVCTLTRCSILYHS